MFDEKSSFGSLALAFFLGAVTGAAVALLYAPMPGKKLQRKVGAAKDKVKDVVEDSVDNVQDAFRKIRKS